MIVVNAKVSKGSFSGWIQDSNEQGITIQSVELRSDDGSRLGLDFDSIEEWQNFIDFFNITDITDMREKPE